MNKYKVSIKKKDSKDVFKSRMYFGLDSFGNYIRVSTSKKPIFEVGDFVSFDGTTDTGRRYLIDGEIEKIQYFNSSARGDEWILHIKFERYEDIYLCQPIYDGGDKSLYGYFTNEEALSGYVKMVERNGADKAVIEETQYGKALYFIRPKYRIDADSTVFVERTYKKDGAALAKSKNKGIKGGARHISINTISQINTNYYV